MPKYFIKDITVGTTKIKTIISDYERTFLQSRWYRGSIPGTGATNFTGFGYYLLSWKDFVITDTKAKETHFYCIQKEFICIYRFAG